MKNLAPLIKDAVEAAKIKDWNLAIELNEEILDADSHNIGALNRLALARMQLGHIRLAEKALKRILEIDKHNKIATKNLARIKKKINNPSVSFNRNSSYIEEPGKAQVIELIRVADKKTLQQASVGQRCYLDPKKEFISIYLIDEADDKKGQYLGALPSEISIRLIKLMNRGNEYQGAVHSVNADTGRCKVLVKEFKVSSENRGVTSFPISKQSQTDLLGDLTTEYLIQEDEESAARNTTNSEDDLETEDDGESFD